MKRTGGATAATLIAWNSSALSVRASETPVSGASGNFSIIWAIFVYASSQETTVTGTGSTPGKALDDLNEKLGKKGVQFGGYSDRESDSGLYDVRNLKSVCRYTRPDGSVKVPTSDGNGGFTISMTLKKGTRFMVIYYE